MLVRRTLAPQTSAVRIVELTWQQRSVAQQLLHMYNKTKLILKYLTLQLFWQYTKHMLKQ
jgi:hypothetical protein